MDVPEDVLFLTARLRSREYEGFAVGGAVRDSLLGRKPGDWDICTSARPEETEAVFSDFPVIETGIKHGTVTVLLSHVPYEITTYRIDGPYSDGRHPDSVRFSRNLTEDLARRDFTMNAMAFSPLEEELSEFQDAPDASEGPGNRPEENLSSLRRCRGVLADPFGGREDLQNKIIRTVGEPEARFQEDALRIVRAFRFAAVLGFDLEEKTGRSCAELAESVHRVSKERVQAELNKLILGPFAGDILAKYRDAVSEALGLALADPESLLRLDGMKAGKAGRLAYIFGSNVRKAMEELKYDNKTKKQAGEVDRFIRNFQNPPQGDRPERYAALKNFLREYGKDVTLEGLRVLAEQPETGQEALACAVDVQGILTRGECWSLEQLAVNGEDLKAMGITGKETGEALNSLLDQVIDGQVPNEKEELLKRVPKKN